MVTAWPLLSPIFQLALFGFVLVSDVSKAEAVTEKEPAASHLSLKANSPDEVLAFCMQLLEVFCCFVQLDLGCLHLQRWARGNTS